MKVGVVTHWWCFENYGQLLQCYAFQAYLRKKGHEPFLIKWYPGAMLSDRLTVHLLLGRLKNPLGFLRSLWYRLDGTTKRRVERMRVVKAQRDFDSFRMNDLTFTRHIYRSWQELNRSEEVDADMYSVGSDVVWKFIPLNDDGRTVFLDFGRESARRISYSPSFGTAKLSEDYKRFAAPLIQRLDAVSVRELSGVQLCREMGRNDAVCVLDPVFLLSKSDYESKFSVASSKSGFFVYLLRMKEPFDFQRIRQLAGNRPVTITTVYDDYGLPPSALANPTIPEWIRLIGQSECVFTNSFHCASMCIIMHTPFVVFLKEGGHGMDDRLLSILKRVGLLSRIYDGNPLRLTALIDEKIDWSRVDQLLGEEKKSSLEFLAENGL